MAIFEHSYKAMGSTFRIRLDTWDNARVHPDSAQISALFAALSTETEDIEQTLSRFRGDSELTCLNEHTGVARTISPCMKEVLYLAQDMMIWTGGAFDPRVLPVMERIGYHGAPITSLTDRPKTEDGQSRSLKMFETIDAHTIVLLSPIDLGGIGKGYTVDKLAKSIERLRNSLGVSGYFVDAGGDIVVSGCQHNGEAWTIGVENPLDPQSLAATITPPLVTQERVGICTSSIWRKSWISQNHQVHHLIDPLKSSPVDNSVMSVTAMAATAALAEIVTKFVFLRGSARSLLWDHTEPYFLIIERDGQLTMTEAIAPFISWTATPNQTS